MKLKKNDENLQRLVENLPKPPKLTKEQKVVNRAIGAIRSYILQNKPKYTDDLAYVIGLLESLVVQDDEEEE